MKGTRFPLLSGYAHVAAHRPRSAAPGLCPPNTQCCLGRDNNRIKKNCALCLKKEHSFLLGNYIATGFTDLRKGIDGLAPIVISSPAMLVICILLKHNSNCKQVPDFREEWNHWRTTRPSFFMALNVPTIRKWTFIVTFMVTFIETCHCKCDRMSP